MISRSVSFHRKGLISSHSDDLTSQIFQLIRWRSLANMSENPALEDLRNYLCKLRNDCGIYSPLDNLIRKACNLQHSASDEQLQNELAVIVQRLQDNYPATISNILRSEKPFLPNRRNEPEEYKKDLEQYLWLIECSVRIGSTVILDELGIYRIVRKEGQLISANLQEYSNDIQKLAAYEPESSTLTPYFQYLSYALSYAGKTCIIGPY